jgi:hypothetical protein
MGVGEAVHRDPGGSLVTHDDVEFELAFIAWCGSTEP